MNKPFLKKLKRQFAICNIIFAVIYTPTAFLILGTIKIDYYATALVYFLLVLSFSLLSLNEYFLKIKRNNSELYLSLKYAIYTKIAIVLLILISFSNLISSEELRKILMFPEILSVSIVYEVDIDISSENIKDLEGASDRINFVDSIIIVFSSALMLIISIIFFSIIIFYIRKFFFSKNKPLDKKESHDKNINNIDTKDTNSNYEENSLENSGDKND